MKSEISIQCKNLDSSSVIDGSSMIIEKSLIKFKKPPLHESPNKEKNIFNNDNDIKYIP